MLVCFSQFLRFSAVLFLTSFFGLNAMSVVCAQDIQQQDAQKQDIEQQNAAQESSPADNSLKSQDFRDWQYRCVLRDVGQAKISEVNKTKTSDADAVKMIASEQSCELNQSVKIKDKDRLIEVLNLSIAKANDKASKVNYALIALTPLDVHLPSGFGVRLDNSKPQNFTYRNCNQLGCWVVIPLSSSLLSQMKRGKEGKAAFRLLNGQAVNIGFSLMGFTDGFNALDKGLPIQNGLPEQMKEESTSSQSSQ